VTAETTRQRTPIRPGERAPDFRLPAVTSDGTEIEFSPAEQLSRGRLVLVFYQDDGMPVCTGELKAFAQEFELLDEAGIGIAGINTNGIGSHQRFQERDHFPFPLISDFHGEAVRAYGFWDAGERKSGRGVVIVGPDGTVAHVIAHFNPGNIAAFEEVFVALGLV
jgi:peroxiredoxin Q/BCP